MTTEELIVRIAQETGEATNSVRYRLQNWRRDGLLPDAPLVSANHDGSGGTRKDWGVAQIIGYKAIRALFPHGKPLSVGAPEAVLAAIEKHLNGRTFLTHADAILWYLHHPLATADLRRARIKVTQKVVARCVRLSLSSDVRAVSEAYSSIVMREPLRMVWGAVATAETGRVVKEVQWSGMDAVEMAGTARETPWCLSQSAWKECCNVAPERGVHD